MPPVLFTFLSTPMTQLAHLLFPTAMANAVIAGAFVFCMSSCALGFSRMLTCCTRCPLRCHALCVSSAACVET